MLGGLAIGFVICLIIWVYWILLKHPVYDVYSYEDNAKYRGFCTGDIILFHALDNLNPVVTGCYFGHIGVVWVDPDRPDCPQLIEAASARTMPLNPGQNPRGIFISDLRDRVNRYSGFIAHKKFKGAVPEGKSREFKNFVQFAQENMEYNYNWFANAIRRRMGHRIGKKVNCGEMTLLCLVHLGILDISWYKQAAMHHLLWMVHLKETPSGQYAEPVWITHSPFS